MKTIALLITLFITCIAKSAPKDDFLITIDTRHPDSSSQITFDINTTGSGYNYNIDCNNDGVDEASQLSHDYTCDYTDLGGQGIYTIRIKDNTPDKTGFHRFTARSWTSRNERKILSLDQWGTSQWSSMHEAFYLATNMVVNAQDIPNLSSVTDMSGMFAFADLVSPEATHWDVSSVKNMSRLFFSVDNINSDLSQWDVSAVTDMSEMFVGVITPITGIDQWDVSAVNNMSGMFRFTRSTLPDINQWNVSSVTDMSSMFQYHSKNLPSLSNWDVSAVTNMSEMFYNYKSSELDLSQWNVSSVTHMSEMFSRVEIIDINIGSWDVSSVKFMGSMFKDATAENLQLGQWNTSSVQNMSFMFQRFRTKLLDVANWDVSSVKRMYAMFANTRINPDVSQWDVSSVEDMSYMFNSNIIANPDVSRWDVSSVTHMRSVFSNARSAIPNISNWDISSVTSLDDMLHNTGLPDLLYDKTLLSWSQLALKPNVVFDAGNSQYCIANLARVRMIENFGWSIKDNGLQCPVQDSDEDFIMAVQVDIDNSISPNQFTIETNSNNYDYNYNVDCNNDGINEATAQSGNYICDYSQINGNGLFRIRIQDNSGDDSGFPAIYANNSDNAKKIRSVEQWGQLRWRSMKRAFFGASNVIINATLAPDLSNVEDLSEMFANTDLADPQVSQWNVSNVTNLSKMFANTQSANPQINNWDVSNVTDTSGMFANASAAKPDIRKWDVSSVNDMSTMFAEISIPSDVYDATLINWSRLLLQPNVTFDVGQSQYCFGDSAKSSIENNSLWTFEDAGTKCPEDGQDDDKMHLSTNGMGQVLLFPYYTVNNGYNTLISLTNTTDQAKALRLRFKEAANSREVFIANIYLAAQDVWTAGLIKNESTQLTTIISQDDTCSIPVINNQGLSFYSDFYLNDWADAYGTEPKRMHEGFFEVIEMGTVIGNSADLITNNNCQALSDAWQADNYWGQNRLADMSRPSGGLTGNTILINVNEGLSVAEPVTTINNFSQDILHFSATNHNPDLQLAQTSITINDKGTVLNLDFETGFEALSALISQSSVQGEYALDEVISAKTDWIISMPTREFHIQGENAIAPFLGEIFINPTIGRGYCDTFHTREIYDRGTESYDGSDHFFLCGTAPPGFFCSNVAKAVCHATNTLSLTSDLESLSSETIFASNYNVYTTRNSGYLSPNKKLYTPYQNGMFEITTHQSTDRTMTGHKVNGLPMIGFAVQTYQNAQAQEGLLANYAGVFDTKTKQSFDLPEDDNANNDFNPMYINEQGVGQVLLYPYYTVRNGLNTLISVVNTSEKTKALKVKFNEGRNARVAYSFNLYIAPFDVWTGALVTTQSTQADHAGETTVKLLTNDNSCTVPYVHNQEFVADQFTNANDDGFGSDLNRVTEGSVEIIEMGELINEEALAAQPINGYPNDCQQLQSNWSPPSGIWLTTASHNIIKPEGKGSLYGSVSIIDVVTGIDYSYDATAINNYTFTQQHSIDPNFPNLASGDNRLAFMAEEQKFVYWDSSIQALSALFMQQQVTNDFVIDDRINAQSEWIFNFPTKALFTEPLFTTEQVPVTPFANEISGSDKCQEFSLIAHDREQMITDPSQQSACWSVNVMSITKAGQTSGILDSNLLIDTPPLLFNEGWLQANFSDQNYQLQGTTSDGQPYILKGLPINGVMLQRFKNGTLNNGEILANYGTTIKNRSTQSRLMKEKNSTVSLK